MQFSHLTAAQSNGNQMDIAIGGIDKPKDVTEIEIYGWLSEAT